MASSVITSGEGNWEGCVTVFPARVAARQGEFGRSGLLPAIRAKGVAGLKG